MLYILAAASGTALILAGLGALTEAIPDKLWRKWMLRIRKIERR